MKLWFSYLSLALLSIGAADALQTSPRRHDNANLERRTFLTKTAASAFAGVLSTIAVPVQPSQAVALLTEKEAEAGIGLPRRMRPNPPSPKKVPRQKLDLDFAVLLTRSSYVEAAQLDIGPVNQLERDMYLVRTSEYQPYRKSVESVQQGDLTDPAYFDYMSFVQYSTINRALKDPEREYEQPEQITDAEGMPSSTESKTVLVKRTLPDELLVPTHEDRVGKTAYDFLNDRFAATPIALPQFDTRPDATQVQEALTKLVNLFVISGLAWEGKAELVQTKGGKSSFLLTLNNPATLWSAQCLAKQNAPLRNDYLLKTARYYVKCMGYTVSSSSVKLDGNKELSYLTIE